MSPDVAASVRGRLLTLAQTQREEFERTLVRYAHERLLYRIGASGVRDRFVVKGASLLAVWMRDPYRATRDIDVLAFGAPNDDAICKLLEDVCAVPCAEDGISFDLTDLIIEDIRAVEEYSGRRARFVALLGTARIRVQMDFGFGDALVTGPEELEFPTILNGVRAPVVLAYPQVTSIAEKFEAMVRLDTRNSRMKDFHDVWAVSDTFGFDGRTLQRAVTACFERRGTPLTGEVPRALTVGFYETPDLRSRWRGYLAAGDVLIPPPIQFEVIGERIIRFLGPVRESLVSAGSFETSWPAGGPWNQGQS